MRKYGLSIDYLISVELVTVEGEVLQASANHNPDLFWAIRGGGGNFSIVTSFEFNLVPLGPEVYGGIVLYPAEEAGEVLRHYAEWAASATDGVTTILMLRRNAFPWSGPAIDDRRERSSGTVVLLEIALSAGSEPCRDRCDRAQCVAVQLTVFINVVEPHGRCDPSAFGGRNGLQRP